MNKEEVRVWFVPVDSNGSGLKSLMYVKLSFSGNPSA